MVDREPVIPFGEQRYIEIPVDYAVFMAEFLQEGAIKVGVFLVDRGKRGQDLAERLVNTELVGSNGEARVVFPIDQMDVNAIKGIVFLTRTVQELRITPDPELLDRAVKAGVIFDNMTAQLMGDGSSKKVIASGGVSEYNT